VLAKFPYERNRIFYLCYEDFQICSTVCASFMALSSSGIGLESLQLHRRFVKALHKGGDILALGSESPLSLGFRHIKKSTDHPQCLMDQDVGELEAKSCFTKVR